MKSKSLEAKVIDARARVAALQGDERADCPSGPERTAYNKELKNAVKMLTKWEAAFASPKYLNGGLREPTLRPLPMIAVPVGGRAYKPELTPAVWPSRPPKLSYGPPRPARSAKRKPVRSIGYETPLSGIGQDKGRKWTGNTETHQCMGCQRWHTARASYFIKQNGRTPGHCACGATSWLPKGSMQKAMVT